MASAQAEARKSYKTHLKTQKENDELWISSEELQTEGSSDDEEAVEDCMSKKSEPRKSLKEKKCVESQNCPSETICKYPKNTRSEEKRKLATVTELSSSTDLDCDRWRPKRGSLTLPDLFDGYGGKVHGESDYLQEIVGDLYNFFPANTREKIFNVKDENYDLKQIEEMFTVTEQLQKQLIENTELLKVEREERLKTQQEMCQEIYNDKNCRDVHASHFLNLCNFEENAIYFTDSDEEQISHDALKEMNAHIRTENEQDKNFIQKNIELAAKAMSKLPLTDEEKQKLDSLLFDIEQNGSVDDETNAEKSQNVMNLSTEEEFDNAFYISDADRERINQIDNVLENFTETQPLRAGNIKDDENFWKSLLLDQSLKEIDQKLADLAEQEKLNLQTPVIK